MAYYVNKTDGTSILVLDGTKDTTSTSLTLIGKLVQSYGESTNENFVWLLENFALGSPPANPTTGQLWYDTTVDNIKSYDGVSWITVGSDIVGNIRLSGNLLVGPNSFKIQDVDGNVSITNSKTSADIKFYSNVNGIYTNTLTIDGTNSEILVNANAVSNYGLTTKIYVDSEIAKNLDYSNIAIAKVDAANIEIIQLKNGLTSANANIAALQANLVQTNVDLTFLAPKNSPVFTGVPAAPTPPIGSNSTQIATTEFVQAAITSQPGPDISGALWQGSRKYVSTVDPTDADGFDGDFWFKYN